MTDVHFGLTSEATVCDFSELPSLYERRDVTARKQHRCAECLAAIAKGERHEFVKGLWAGAWSSFRTCRLCTGLVAEINVTCYSHGLLMDVIDDRDFPGVESVTNFFDRRKANWELLQS